MGLVLVALLIAVAVLFALMSCWNLIFRTLGQ